MMRRTDKLRFVKRAVDKDVYRVLQQQWVDEDPRDEGPIRCEWRDVPLAEESL